MTNIEKILEDINRDPRVIVAAHRTWDPDLEKKTLKTNEKICENLHMIANDPSLAFYRLQEHVGKSLPPMIEKRKQVYHIQSDLQGATFDADYAVGSVRGMLGASSSFSNIQELLRNAIFFHQQDRYVRTRRRQQQQQQPRPRSLSQERPSQASGRTGIYNRLSQLSLELDLPDFASDFRHRASQALAQASNITHPQSQHDSH
ncbi:unnamed protein product [Darwinula stevensoni]|uniref:BLOC-1-related complex subunit 8 n=1 Tax=Darwinula stevensoni TaxID=69355 RepID=A0A7R8XB93_9CRUS|nr:unnamed protein product [Darwinula stevensoni]CAG0890817.1 unnamed protein product [Darwinula stevensoni]